MNEAAKKRALSLLEKRDYSRKMLLDKLTEKGASEPEATEICDWLCDLGVVDDARYAALAVRHYAAKGYGERRIRDELFRRGVPRELWDEALSQLPENDDAAYRLLCQKLRGWNGDPAGLQRAQGALLRRGFSWDDVRAALERFRSENEDLL